MLKVLVATSVGLLGCGHTLSTPDASASDAAAEVAPDVAIDAEIDPCLAGYMKPWQPLADVSCGNMGISPNASCSWRYLCGQTFRDDAGIPLSGNCFNEYRMNDCIDGGVASGCPKCAPGERCVSFNEYAPPTWGAGTCCQAYACVTATCFPDAGWPLDCTDPK